jgi:hypothetical protein
MIKDKLHTISDEDAIQVATLLMKTSTSSMFEFTPYKVERQEYVEQHGVDAEESVNVFFNCVVKNDVYRKSGWKDKKVWIQLIERDRYHNYPYFTANYMEETDKVWKHQSLSNHIEAIEFLQSKNLL